ncbi:MAG: CoA transferase, partial [Pseudomonadota bacterium]
CQALGAPALAEDPRFASNIARVENRPELDALLGEIFAATSRDEMTPRLATARIAYGRLSSLADLAAHPQARFVRVETEGGPVELLAPAAIVAGQAPSPGPVRGLDADGTRLRQEFGTT